MTFAEAKAIADEQIAFWRQNGLSADDAWRALGLDWAWATTWPEVREQLMRWLRYGDAGLPRRSVNVRGIKWRSERQAAARGRFDEPGSLHADFY